MSSVSVWVTKAEVMLLPTSGAAWDTLKKQAANTQAPNVSDQNNQNDVSTLARAMVGVRTNNLSMITKVKTDILKVANTPLTGRTLAASRNIPAYVAAAGIIDLQTLDPAGDLKFRTWLKTALTKNLEGKTIISTHEERPNNWGTWAGAARISIALYTGDTAQLARSMQVFKGWLGDRSAYAGFDFGDLSWQSDKSKPVAILPVGAMISGHSVSGAMPEELRRAGGFRWPPPKENYQWEAMQGAIVQAELLYKAGYTDTYQWSDQALFRAYKFINNVASYPPEGDDRWITFVVNKRYASAFPTYANASAGKGMGFTAWTHR